MYFSPFHYLLFLAFINCQQQRQTGFQLKAPTDELNLKHIFHFGSPEPQIKVDNKKNSAIQQWDADKDKDYTPTYKLNLESLSKVLVANKDKDEIFINNDDEITLESKEGILILAKMAAHAYDTLPNEPWEDIGKEWDVKQPFGWKKKKIRGYIFSDKEEKNMVISFKGTSPPYLPGGDSSTSPSDRDSDNLMFSCCCGVTNFDFSKVCSCAKDNKTCDSKCVNEGAQRNTTYFHGAELIYKEAREKYPNAQFILVGHSLGGALASLVALKYDQIAVTFEAPPERLYARRLGLELNKTQKPAIFHFGNNADPLFLGTCNGALSLCYIAGYGMDSKCHTATKCVFDTKKDLGWSETLLHHTIAGVIDSILVQWMNNTKPLNVNCFSKSNCTDCTKWDFTN